MKFRDAIIKNYNDLPGYKLVGYSEVAVPMYQRKVHILKLIKKSIPVVEEFVLNFYKEGLNLDQIKSLLGLDQQLIDEAMAGLIQRDYINNFTKEVSDIGQEYLKNNNVEVLEKDEFSIIIDGMTGEIKKDNVNLITTRNIKNKGIRALRANISKPTVREVDFKALRRVFNQYKEMDSESFTGDMIDVIHMEGNTTKYKRVDLLIFENSDKDVRIIVFDGFNRLENYEERMREIDSNSITLLKYNYGEYFSSVKVNEIMELVTSQENSELINYENINTKYDTYLEHYNKNIVIVIPLVSQFKITEAFIEKIENNVKSGVNINFIICGREYIGENQKKMYQKLKNISLENKNLKMRQTPRYFNKMILDIDNKISMISVYEKNTISLSSTKEGMVEYVYEVKDIKFETIWDIIKSDINEIEEIKFDLSKVNKGNLMDKIDKLLHLIKDLDGYMYSNDEIGWIGNDEIPDIQRFKEIPFAIDEEKFKIFIDSINKSLVESLELNAKLKGQKEYFWKKFARQYPELQKILNKIKTYRNKSYHLELNENNKERYFKFLNEDMKGYMPEFIENGYLILQFKILDELEIAIKNLIKYLR
ncbi:hypothetical protein LGK99_11135 [Clostridium algidicarnis]|uniref:hypothetical protein n=1 Tax=Clostridium algidicarnis TaxID=37659 RepID=UPI001CF5FE22|nr:hypothetical protein [Clostridium algidicarnis]MCB2287631.1 hypothetical protein [Clostridium algidicarnis]